MPCSMSERKCRFVISVAFEMEFVVAIVWAVVVAFAEFREKEETRVPNFCDLLFALPELCSKVW